MGRYLFRLPDVGEGVTEAEIVAWHVKPGDRIREDDNLADVMTDKATVEMTSPAPKVVDQFEYPRLPVEWQGANPPATFDVAPGNGRMSPWEVDSQVQLIRAATPSQGGLGSLVT